MMTRPHAWSALALLAMAACHAEMPYEKPVTPVSVTIVAEAAADNVTRYSATVDAVTKVDLAFRVGGYVRTVATIVDGGTSRPVREGDRVRRGQALAAIDRTDNTERASQVHAQIDEATVAAAQADRTLDRARALFEKDALSRPELEAAQTAADVARARVAAGGAGLRQVEAVLDDHTLVAPFDGVLLRKTVNVGALAAPGIPAFTLADTSRVKAVFGVPDVVLPQVRQADITVQADAFPGTTFPARLTFVAPAADPRGRIFEVELTIPNSDGRLRPGMIATVELRQGQDTRADVVVPLAAVIRPAGATTGYAVFVVEGMGSAAVAKQRAVELGELRGNLVTVSRGLRGGERVVTSGAAMVTDGAAVRVVL